jgi:hypothetical protein
MIRRLLATFTVAALAVVIGVVVIPTATAVQVVDAKALTDHECNATEWHFVINQLADDSLAPDTIHVEWSNGNDEDVPLDTVTPGGVAHYTTTANLDSTLTSATADLYDEWTGQFNLSHGPCNETTTTTTTTTPTVQTLPVTTTTQPVTTAPPQAGQLPSTPIAQPVTVVVTAQPTQTG